LRESPPAQVNVVSGTLEELGDFGKYGGAILLVHAFDLYKRHHSADGHSACVHGRRRRWWKKRRKSHEAVLYRAEVSGLKNTTASMEALLSRKRVRAATWAGLVFELFYRADLSAFG